MSYLLLTVFASVFLALNGLPKSRWGFLEQRLHDAPEDEDTLVLRSFPKTPFNELQLRRYCRGYQEHFGHFCSGKQAEKKMERSKVVDFCIDYEKYCPKAGNTDADQFLAIPPPLPDDVESSDSLVVPPKLPGNRLNPTMDSPVAFDLPLSASQKHLAPEKIRLTPEIIKTCTADCTLPHCTTECKCAHTYPVVHAMCNPPPHGDLVITCNKWYVKCPMFKPVSYYNPGHN